ncbi:MAG: hypothetical protein JO164_02735 [Candidatus Eremiobacteraeota bacterium]|nr:hypothetical protein [Candidatus Eremiobacteraeota bacterium]
MIKRSLSGLAAAALLAGCNAGGLSQTPSVSQANLSTVGRLQLAVGTVNIGTDSNAIGLNVVTTFRQANGLSAVLLDTPTITGPTGFTNTAGAAKPYDTSSDGSNCAPDTVTAGSDSGTNAISGDQQVASNVFVPSHSLGEAALVGAYGIQPFNASEGSTAFYAGNINSIDCGFGFGRQHTGAYQAYPQPFYLSAAAIGNIRGTLGLHWAPSYLGGPPSYPFYNDGSALGGFAGFVPGFTTFELTPVTGTYSISVNIPASNASSATVSATATLTSTAPLPALGTPTFTSDGNGGGSGTIAVPADPRITETMVYVYDLNSSSNFSVGPITGTGTLHYTLPDGLGSCIPVGCQTTNPSKTLTSGDAVYVYAASFDYPMFEASPPTNKSQTPTITGSTGQADISLSPILKTTE